MKFFRLLNSPKKLFCVLFFLISVFGFSQDSSIDEKSEKKALPNGYSTVKLGMTLEAVKSALLREPDFGYRGERDVSLLPGENRHLIETKGGSFLDNCWFQFYNESLYIISVNVNKDFMDYYSIFKTLCQKYGNPNYLDPEKATWEDKDVILSLEKPLCLKYTDAQISDQILQQSSAEKAAVEYLREGFLNSL